MADSGSTGSGGVGFFGLLGLLFIGLKLGGCIHWPWIWVLAPIWGPLAFGLVLSLLLILMALPVGLVGLLVAARKTGRLSPRHN